MEYYEFLEQFANSPFISLVEKKTIEKEFIPIINLREGIRQKIIKDIGHSFLTDFIFKPISYLANPRLYHGLKLNKEDLEKTFNMVWGAIKL